VSSRVREIKCSPQIDFLLHEQILGLFVIYDKVEKVENHEHSKLYLNIVRKSF
jgi:hypothetical protein